MEYMIGSDGLYKITESGSIITMENYRYIENTFLIVLLLANWITKITGVEVTCMGPMILLPAELTLSNRSN